MNSILDTNIFVAANFSPHSSSAQILKAAEKGNLSLTWNDITKYETKKMLDQIPRISWEKFQGNFKEENKYNEYLQEAEFKCIDDPDDRKFAALGEATDCIIVTNDQDLLTQKSKIHTPLMTPRKFSSHYSELMV